ncbi:MAG: hypothetical protein AB1443_03780 [Pseudomonadota bacterium]
MKANGLGYKEAEFVAEIEKGETTSNFKDIVDQLTNVFEGKENQKLHFFMVCEPEEESIVDGKCVVGQGKRKFCAAFICADESAHPEYQAGRGVKIKDLGDKFAVSFENGKGIEKCPPSNVREFMHRLFDNSSRT